MSTTAHPASWPADPDHRDAIDTVLDMASAEARWGDHSRALVLLERVERIVGALPPGYERIRRRASLRDARFTPRGPRVVKFPHAVVASTRRGSGRPAR